MGFAPQFGLGGFTNLAVSNVEIIDGGNFIRVFGVTNGAEELVIDFTPSKLNQFLENKGFIATKSVTGAISLQSQVKSFPLTKQLDKNYFEFTTREISRFSSCSSSTPTGYISLDSVPTLSLGKVCLYKRSLGSNSVFTGRDISRSEVVVSIGGASGVLKPSSGSNTLTLNDGKTKIEWVGNLNNYDQITSPDSYTVLFHESKFQKMIDRDAYTLSVVKLDQFSSCVGGSSSGGLSILNIGVSGIFSLQSKTTIKNCVNSYNNGVTGLLVDKTDIYKNSINSKGISFDDNSLNVDLKTASQFPTFIITLDADKVGIKELSGTPQIVSCVANTKINSGDTFNPTLSVRNTGSSAGSFFGSVSCLGQASGSGIISEQLVEGGETVNMPIQVSGTNIVEGTSSAVCTYKIQDRKSGSSDTCSSRLDVEYQSGIVCEPSTEKCLGANTLRICSSDGKSFDDKECEFGCSALESGAGICQVKEGEGGSQIDCKFGESYYEKDSRLFGLIAGKQGCSTSGWVYAVIGIITALVGLIATIVVIRLRRLSKGEF